jgi:XTP/dITP diphosphohydrolase
MMVLIATGNRGKLREIRQMLAPLGFDALGLADVAVAGEPVEDGATFEDNARLKAEYYGKQAGLPVIADDSGLCVEALGGRPGVHSARYAGFDAPAQECAGTARCAPASGANVTDAANNAKLLREMAGVADRRARFVCVAVCRRPDGAELVARGECEGVLLDAPRGTDGFGYDPLFFVPSLNATFAELPPALKNQISHRGRALQKLGETLAEFL